MYRRLFWCLTLWSAASAPLLRADVLSVGSASVIVGDEFLVPVDISAATDLFAFQFDVAYDPAILQLVAIGEGGFLPVAGSTFFLPGFIDNAFGSATFTADTLLGPGPGAAGGGTLVSLDFQAIGAGASSISLANVFLLDSNLNGIESAAVSARVTATAPGGTTVPEAGTGSFLGLGMILFALSHIPTDRRRTRSGK